MAVGISFLYNSEAMYVTTMAPTNDATVGEMSKETTADTSTEGYQQGTFSVQNVVEETTAPSMESASVIASNGISRVSNPTTRKQHKTSTSDSFITESQYQTLNKKAMSSLMTSLLVRHSRSDSAASETTTTEASTSSDPEYNVIIKPSKVLLDQLLQQVAGLRTNVKYQFDTLTSGSTVTILSMFTDAVKEDRPQLSEDIANEAAQCQIRTGTWTNARDTFAAYGPWIDQLTTFNGDYVVDMYLFNTINVFNAIISTPHGSGTEPQLPEGVTLSRMEVLNTLVSLYVQCTTLLTEVIIPSFDC